MAARAEASEKTGAEGRPWPEFAEYECYACHRDLKLLNEKDDLKYQKAKYGKRHIGSFPYGTWYLTLLPDVSARLGARDPLLGEIDAVRKEMERPGPNPAEVAAKAKAASKRLDGLIDRVKRGEALDAAQVRGYAKAVLDDGLKRADAMSWDEATQLYLAVAAAHQALYDLNDPAARGGRLRPALVKVKDRLRSAFPPGADNPGLFSPTRPPTLADQLRAIREQLGD